MNGRGGVVSSIAVVGALAAVASLAALAPGAGAAGDGDCSAPFRVEETLPNGATWSLCWERRALEGIVLHDVTYTPPGGSATLVMGQMNLAQIHVPYDDNLARFHDESDFGLGFNLLELDGDDCPGGTVLGDGTQQTLCRQVRDLGYAYKDYGAQDQAHSLALFSVSAIGAYNYVVEWNLDDDGTIRPMVGATGRLQRFGGGTATGWRVGTNRIAVAHLHNYYWRLDVDLAGSADDRVQELASTPAGDRQSFAAARTPFLSEAARRVQPRTFRSWRVLDPSVTNADGHRISYELLPSTDHIFRGPGYEPFTHNELYVTRAAPCERFASHNPATGGCGRDLSDYVDGEALRGADVVLWYGTSFHHLPRDEDEERMPAHWSGFSLVPRDLTATNPRP